MDDATSRVSFRLIGSLECWYDGKRIRLGGAIQERVLVMLLLEANSEPFPTSSSSKPVELTTW
ncbi:hypothetical protein OH717_01900 [Streptomyces albidoflavus]|nr:hypothetical protein OH717_01900 [Streptomyces albidoflavus]